MDFNKESKKRIACVIVTYNRKQLLKRCLDAVASQSLKPATVFVVDNASTDGTMEAVKEWGYYKQEVNNIRYEYILNSKNEGGAGGFYIGMKTAFEEDNYDGIWVMDDDGEPAEGCLENLAKHLETYKYIAPLVLAIEDNNVLAFPFHEINTPQGLIEKWGSIVPNYACPFNGILYSRKLVEEIGFPIKELFIWGDEVNYHLRAIESGAPPVTVVNAIHYHPRCKDVFVKSLLGKKIVFVPQKWKGFCHYRNYVYNMRKRISSKSLISYYLKHVYYFAFILKSPAWIWCFNKAFFAGLIGDLRPHYLKYMKS